MHQGGGCNHEHDACEDPVLVLHPFFDLSEGVVIDDLHGIYLGVTLSLLHNWFDKSNKGKPYNIGNKVNIIIPSLCVNISSHEANGAC